MESAYAQVKKPFPFSLTGDIPENPDQGDPSKALNVCLEEPVGPLLLIVSLLFECWLILLAFLVFILSNAASLWGPRPTQ